MRTKKFILNSISTAFYQIVLMIAGFITPHIMLKYYGSEINGLISSISQFIIYFNLVEAGLSGAATYALYKPLSDGDKKGINGIVTAARKFYTQSGYIFISLTIGLAVFYPILVKSNLLTPLHVAILVLILGVNGTLEFFTMAKYRVLLTADQRTYVISLASLAHIVLNTSIIAFLGSMQVNVVILYSVALVSIFLRSFILMLYSRKKYSFLDYNEEPNYHALSKRWDALYLQILGAVQLGAPVVILTLITKNLMIISVYTVFNMVLAGVNGILSIFISGLSASFGDLIARNETKNLQKAYGEFEFAYYGLITVVYAVAFVTIMPFIRVYTNDVTDIDYNIPVIGFLFVLNGLLHNIKTPQGMLVISAGLFKETKAQTTIQAIISVLVGIILSPFFGIVGVLIGSILSNLYRDIDLLFYIPKNVTKLPVKNTVLRLIRMLIAISIIYFLISLIEINPISFLEWIIMAIIFSLISAFVVIVLSIIFDRLTLKSLGIRILRIIRK